MAGKLIAVRKRIRALLSEMWFGTLSFFDDLSRSTFYEVVFAGFIVSLLLWTHFNLYDTSVRLQIVSLFFLWAFLALQGFFIPTVRESWSVAIGGNLEGPGPKDPGVPLQIKFESRGGFIAGRKIRIHMRVLEIGNEASIAKKFTDTYAEASFVFFQSVSLPFRLGKMLKGAPESGGITIKGGIHRAKSAIMFQSPGEFSPMVMFTLVGNPRQFGGPIPEGPMSHKLKVSPSENWVSLRNYCITYALTLVILLLTLIQVGFL